MSESGSERVDGTAGRTGPRRRPPPSERRRDAERTRARLLAAALDAFSDKGFAGARVHDIAERAGVNKQLINYYFGGKEGLYRELQRSWLDREATLVDSDLPLGELLARYLHDALADPRLMRLLVWRGFSEGTPPSTDSPGMGDLSSMLRRQAEGEVARDLDAASVRLLLIGAVAAPIVMPHVVRQIFGLDPRSPGFEERYGEQLRRIVRHLAE